jgi:hypothetical protein
MKTKKSGGNDSELNVIPLCRKDHQAFHKMGIMTAAEKWPKLKQWLENSGWFFCPIRNTWRQEHKINNDES